MTLYERDLVRHYGDIRRRLYAPRAEPPTLPKLVPLRAIEPDPVPDSPEPVVTDRELLTGLRGVYPLGARPLLVAVARETLVPVYDLVGPCRCRDVVRPRQIAMYIARELLPNYSLPKVGGIFGGRDHTTILHAIRQVAKRIDADPDVAAMVDRIRRRLTEGAESAHRDISQQIAAYRRRGLMASEIAAELGLTAAEVYRIEERAE